MSHGINLSKAQCLKTQNYRDWMNKNPYVSIIGSIIYDKLYIHPNVSYTLSMTSKYQSNLEKHH